MEQQSTVRTAVYYDIALQLRVEYNIYNAGTLQQYLQSSWDQQELTIGNGDQPDKQYMTDETASQ